MEDFGERRVGKRAGGWKMKVVQVTLLTCLVLTRVG